jgi:hypothetical protein
MLDERAGRREKQGGEGKDISSMETSFREKGKTAGAVIAERINADLADMGETMRVNQNGCSVLDRRRPGGHRGGQRGCLRAIPLK